MADKLFSGSLKELLIKDSRRKININFPLRYVSPISSFDLKRENIIAGLNEILVVCNKYNIQDHVIFNANCMNAISIDDFDEYCLYYELENPNKKYDSWGQYADFLFWAIRRYGCITFSFEATGDYQPFYSLMVRNGELYVEELEECEGC